MVFGAVSLMEERSGKLLAGDSPFTKIMKQCPVPQPVSLLAHHKGVKGGTGGKSGVDAVIFDIQDQCLDRAGKHCLLGGMRLGSGTVHSRLPG